MCVCLCVSQQYSVYPIIWAAGRGHADIVKVLLNNGAKVNCSDKVKKVFNTHVDVQVEFNDLETSRKDFEMEKRVWSSPRM